MPKITEPETIMEVGVDPYYSGGPRRVMLTFDRKIVTEKDGKISVKLTKRQTTQLVNALKSQRKRKGVQ